MPMVEQSRKNDPNVKLPAAVQRAAARAEELSKGNVELVISDNSLPNNTPPNGTTVVSDFDPKNPKPPIDIKAEPKAVTAPAPEPIQEAPNYEQQYKSAQGRLQAKEEENRRLAAHIRDQERLLASISTIPPVNNTIINPPPLKRLTDKEIAEFGPEIIEVMGKRAEEVVAPLVAQLVNEIQSLKGQVGGVRNTMARTAQEQVFDQLEREMPGAFQRLNFDPGFAAWLDSPDDLSGMMRRQLLNDAYAKGQANRVISFFRNFQNSNQGSNQVSGSPVEGVNQQPGNGATLESIAPTPRVDLASLAAPGKAKSGQSNLPPEKPIYTRADIASFYKDKTLGHFAGREQEAAELERSIIEAGREGRVR